MFDLILGVFGLERDGYEGSVLLSLAAVAIFYFGCQYYSVKVLAQYNEVLFVSFILMTVLIFRYTYDISNPIRGIIWIILLVINLGVSVALSFIFFSKLGHDPLYLWIDYLGNHDSLFLRIVCFFVMIIDVYIRVCFFRIIQKIALLIMYVIFRLPFALKKSDERAKKRQAYEKKQKDEEKAFERRISEGVARRIVKRDREKREELSAKNKLRKDIENITEKGLEYDNES